MQTVTNSKEIVVISHFFPPLNEVGSLRLYAFAHYLSEMYPVHVLTSEKIPRDGPLNLNTNNSNFRVTTIQYYPKFFLQENLLSKLSAAWILFQHRLGGALDFKILWVYKVRAFFKEEYKPETEYTIICSYSPIHSFLAGYLIKKTFANVKLIYDYRDLWYKNPYVKVFAPFAWMQRVIERRLLKLSDHVITVSKGLAKDLESHFNICASIVENGFFPEEVAPHAFRSRIVKTSTTIVYTGYIYKNRRDPKPLFIAVRELLDEGYFKSENISIDFYGSQEELIKPLISNLNLGECVKVYPKVNRERVLELQRNADCLLFLEWDDPRASGVLTGKLFEYLVSGNHILSIGPTLMAESSRLILETNTGFVCGNSIPKIKEAVKKVVQNPQSYSPRWDIIEQYSRKSQTQRLQKIIEL